MDTMKKKRKKKFKTRVSKDVMSIVAGIPKHYIF